MNIKIWQSLIIAALTTLFFGSCQDWGETDPPAGNQVYPKLEKIASYTFDEEVDQSIIELLAYSNGAKPEQIDDNERGSKVLHMNGGYARINNSLNSVKVQNGVSLTFWTKQVSQTDETQDLEGALFSFQNENGAQKLFFTANGWLSYDGIDGKYEVNNPSGYKTGMISPNEWHYVAMTIRDDGYAVYVNGERKIDTQITDFDFSKIVQFMASAPYLYIGQGSDTQTGEWMIDDLTIYRNQITDSQIKVPGTGGGEEENKYIIVGNEDMTTAWWTEFSDLVTMTGDQTMHFGFYNYTNGNANWNNWVLVLTNGKNRDESGYAEHFVLRADAFGWGDANYVEGNITHNFNFDDGSFTNDMKGAYVDLTLKRSGNRIDMTAVVTSTGGTVYNYTFYYEGLTTTDVGAFLTCEGSYLAIDPETVYVGQSYAAGAYKVGPTDLSAPWWTYFSDFTKITGNTAYPFAYTFDNYGGGSNWNNWLLVVTNGKNRDEAGYAEYFVIRSDAYGWGDSNYDGNNISHSYDFDNFVAQMRNSHCMVIVTRSANRVDMTAKVTATDGTKLGDYTFYYEGVTTTDIGMFLTVDGSSLDVRSVAYYPFLNK